jgi:mono/diheme cytochrome c family protein
MRRHAVLAVTAVAMMAGAIAVTATLWPDASYGGLSITSTDAALVTRGKAVYEANCAVCHGAQLEGQADWQSRRPDGRLPAPPHDVTGHTWHHDDATLLLLTLRGPSAFAGPDYISAMPSYEGVLSTDDLRTALAFIKSTWPPEIQARQAAASAAAARRR